MSGEIVTLMYLFSITTKVYFWDGPARCQRMRKDIIFVLKRDSFARRLGCLARHYENVRKQGDSQSEPCHMSMGDGLCIGIAPAREGFQPRCGRTGRQTPLLEMLAVNVAFTNTQPTPDGRQAGSWELRPTTPRQQPAICGIFDQSPLAGIILATRLPMTCGSCSPEEPSSV
jgi:hypothetical protein